MKKRKARAPALLLCLALTLGLLPVPALAAEPADVRGALTADGIETGDGIPDSEQYFVTFDLGDGTYNHLKTFVLAVRKAVADRETTRQELIALAGTIAAAIQNDKAVFDGWDIDLSKLKLDGDITIHAHYRSNSGGSAGTTIGDDDTPAASAPAAVTLDRTDHIAYVSGYPDDSFRPNGAITRAETAAGLYRLLSAETRTAYASDTNSFADCYPDAWYNDAVSTLANAGILNGYSNGTFRPDAPISRAELTAVVLRFYAASEGADAADAFTDVAGSWARVSIDRAAALGLVHGYADGSFRPEQSVTRAEAVTLLNGALGREPDAAHLLSGMKTWTDNADPGAWYYAAVQEAGNGHAYTLSAASRTEIWTSLTA